MRLRYPAETRVGAAQPCMRAGRAVASGCARAAEGRALGSHSFAKFWESSGARQRDARFGSGMPVDAIGRQHFLVGHVPLETSMGIRRACVGGRLPATGVE